MTTVEYLGTGPNPIDVPRLKTEKPLSKGDRAQAQDDVAAQLVAQGLFKIVADDPLPEESELD